LDERTGRPDRIEHFEVRSSDGVSVGDILEIDDRTNHVRSLRSGLRQRLPDYR